MYKRLTDSVHSFIYGDVMPYKVFVIPAQHGEWAERELNDFVRSHRVLAMDRRWVDQGENSFWAVWIDYLDVSAARGADTSTATSKKKVDYKELLSTEDFEVYLGLRALRKAIAAEEGVALYAVFTNDQLAQMVERRIKSRTDLQQIAGIGEARVEKPFASNPAARS